MSPARPCPRPAPGKQACPPARPGSRPKRAAISSGVAGWMPAGRKPSSVNSGITTLPAKKRPAPQGPSPLRNEYTRERVAHQQNKGPRSLSPLRRSAPRSGEIAPPASTRRVAVNLPLELDRRGAVGRGRDGESEHDADDDRCSAEVTEWTLANGPTKRLSRWGHGTPHLSLDSPRGAGSLVRRFQIQRQAEVSLQP